MNLLDENVRDDQRTLLRQWRIPFRQVGKEISRAGIHDDNLLPLLYQLKRATFFTQDEDFFKARLCHRAEIPLCRLVHTANRRVNRDAPAIVPGAKPVAA